MTERKNENGYRDYTRKTLLHRTSSFTDLVVQEKHT